MGSKHSSSDAWVKFLDYIVLKGIKASLGLIGNGLEKGDHVYLQTLAELSCLEYFEFWNHGYDHLLDGRNGKGELCHEFLIALTRISFGISRPPKHWQKKRINYSAAQGLYIGASVSTKASESDITLRSSLGTVVLDQASFQTSTGSNDISVEAGTYISAKGTVFTTKNSGHTRLTANQSLDLTGANIRSGSIELSAFNDTKGIITTNTDFNGVTPNKTANNGNALTKP